MSKTDSRFTGLLLIGLGPHTIVLFVGTGALSVSPLRRANTACPARKDHGSEDARDGHDLKRLVDSITKTPCLFQNDRTMGCDATMGDTKATRAGATAAAPCTGRIYFPLCFVLSFRKNSFVRRLYPPRNSSSGNFCPTVPILCTVQNLS